MADAKPYIEYSAEDIQRYLTGGMSAKEMHDMERAALQDPFLADAIEGYSEASFEQSQQHLNEIAATLQKEDAGATIVTMPRSNFQWWKVAAMILIIAGVGMFSWFLIQSNVSDEHAKNIAAVQKKDSVTTPTKDNALVKPVDTARLFPDNSIQEKNKVENNETHVRRADKVTNYNEGDVNIKAEIYKKSPANSDVKSLSDTIMFHFSTAKPAIADTINSFASGLELTNGNTQQQVAGKGASALSNKMYSNQFNGRITDDKNAPVPNVVVSANNRIATVTDTGGYFKMMAPDSLLSVTVSSVGYEIKNLKLSTGYMNNISLQPNASALNEVVVTGYGKQKTTLKKSAADTSFPVGGWQSFQEYVYKKTHKKFDSTEFELLTRGDVEIEFSIDSNGNPYNFRVLHSIDAQTDAKAIDIIKDGPRWITTKKNKKGKVVIKF